MKMIKRLTSMLMIGILVVVVIVSGCTGNSVPSEVKLHDVHGVVYSEDGTSLYVANPGYFLVHQASGWHAQVNTKGFTNVSLTKQGMYLSGQQGAEKQQKPLGLAKSVDGGKSVTSLAFKGEVDFPLLATSFYKGAVYTYNTSGAGNLQNGLNFTADDGQHWTHAKLQGLEGKVSAIAVSSYEDDFVAVGTNDGVYFSDDHGDTIKYELSNVFQNVTALAFDAYNPDQLYVATGGEQSTVYFVGNYNQISTSIKGGFQHYPMLFSLPKGDEITCLAYSPKLDRIAVATKKSEVYEYDKRSRKVTKLTETGIATIAK